MGAVASARPNPARETRVATTTAGAITPKGASATVSRGSAAPTEKARADVKAT